MKTIPEIVQRAYNEGIISIGQLSKSELYQLNKYVKSGYLMKVIDCNTFPIPKDRYTMNWNDLIDKFRNDPGYIKD
jgi:lysophospholipid acyltransferase (LPLAT)-like uncharacterized protein